MNKTSSAKGGSASGGKTYIWIVVAAVVIGGGILLLSQRGGNTPSNSSSSNLYPEQSVSHGHGLAVDVKDSNKLYIATHYGLLVLMNEKDLFRVGKSRDDYMGFSLHPTEANVFFSSGHPSRGGNLGVQKSENGGITWRKISNGVRGPVDFHEMTISPANPALMYGWYEGNLQRSIDGGKNWEIAEALNLPEPIGVVADSKNENKLYALTIYGVSLSEDKGNTWQDVFPALRLNLVTTFANHPHDSQKFAAFSRKLGFMISNDAGKSWDRMNETFGGDFPVFIAFSPTSPEWIYVLTKENKIYKSIDNGKIWSKIR